MDHQTRSSQISFAPIVQQQENWAVRKSRLLRDGQITEQRIHTYPFDDEKGQCLDLDECTVYRNSPQSMPRFTIYSTRKGHSQHAVHSSLTVMLLYLSGVHCWSHRKGSTPQYWCLGSFVWQHPGVACFYCGSFFVVFYQAMARMLYCSGCWELCERSRENVREIVNVFVQRSCQPRKRMLALSFWRDPIGRGVGIRCYDWSWWVACWSKKSGRFLKSTSKNFSYPSTSASIM